MVHLPEGDVREVPTDFEFLRIIKLFAFYDVV